MPATRTAVTIREFQAGDEAAFRRLNEEWISRYFKIEPKDEASFAEPKQTILDRGGRIWLAFREGQAIGCCCLLALAAGEYEVGKMAVTESARGTGIGRSLLAKAIEEARALKARRLYLETNQTLLPAIRLYESMGFRHLPPERVVPSPYARANVYMEMFL